MTVCHSLKMLAADGKMRLTDVADTEQLFRLVQSILSKKAEPFKLWLAKMGRERADEIEDPEIGIDRLMETYLRKGYSKAWAGYSVKDYKQLKRLKKENLRDNMTNLELVLNMLAEATTTAISKEKEPDRFQQNKKIAREGGSIAGNTRKQIEEKTGKAIVTSATARKQLQNKKNKN
ncbi:hypothetical protein SAMN04487894_10368 [Niabella drilacis]|uniref:BRO family, N-terminal domain n=1 Tax=Niabella drilacis (strain DSM 25811 / CCM 8410 / CCUG 62505 / LMG 26954 / E90) TaxID=1285928 RepID=A0A1G6MWN4_NIADE|nr:hypothetical protein SAMN04487894_10368 [Niabella drilacis]